MSSLSSLTYKPDRQSGGDHPLQRDEGSQTCKYKSINRGSTESRRHLWVSPAPAASSSSPASLKKLLIWLLSKPGRYLALLFTSKDTWKKSHIKSVASHAHRPVWCHINLQEKRRKEGKKETFFIFVIVWIFFPSKVVGKLGMWIKKESWFADTPLICLSSGRKRLELVL